MPTKNAINTRAVLVNAECRCGGAVIDAVTGSFDLDGEHQICDACGADIILPKRVKFGALT